jgi:hypothetical protein
LYLFVSSGTQAPNRELMSTGVTVAVTATDCVVVDGGANPCGVLSLRNYFYEFSHPSSAPIRLEQATQAPWSIEGRPFIVRNHLSYATGECDSNFNWGFSIAAR